MVGGQQHEVFIDDQNRRIDKEEPPVKKPKMSSVME